jgi:hypothetical protein
MLTVHTLSDGGIPETIQQYGCAFISRCFDPLKLVDTLDHMNDLYAALGTPHIQPPHLRQLNHPPFHEYLFDDRHYKLLDDLFKDNQWVISESTSTRRIGPENNTYMPALCPHLDAFYHSFDFTVNFWVPLQPCGDGTTPGLSVYPQSRKRAEQTVGFIGSPVRIGRGWNFDYFDARWERMRHSPKLVADFTREQASVCCSPSFELGDALLLTNWVLHATGPGSPQARRTNMELRFCEVTHQRPHRTRR